MLQPNEELLQIRDNMVLAALDNSQETLFFIHIAERLLTDEQIELLRSMVVSALNMITNSIH